MAYFPPTQSINISASYPIPIISSLGIGNLSYMPALTAGYTKIGTPPAGAKAVRMYLSNGDSIKFTISSIDITSSVISTIVSFVDNGPNWDEQLSNNNNIYISGISGSPLYRWL